MPVNYFGPGLPTDTSAFSQQQQRFSHRTCRDTCCKETFPDPTRRSLDVEVFSVQRSTLSKSFSLFNATKNLCVHSSFSESEFERCLKCAEQNKEFIARFGIDYSYLETLVRELREIRINVNNKYAFTVKE